MLKLGLERLNSTSWKCSREPDCGTTKLNFPQDSCRVYLFPSHPPRRTNSGCTGSTRTRNSQCRRQARGISGSHTSSRPSESTGTCHICRACTPCRRLLIRDYADEHLKESQYIVYAA